MWRKLAWAAGTVVAVCLLSFLMVFSVVRPSDRWSVSEERVLFARLAVEDFRADFGKYPPVEHGLKVLLRKPPEERRGARYRKNRYLDSEEATVDSWGRPIGFAVSGVGCLVYSFGADGVPGGLGDDADIIRECIDKKNEVAKARKMAGR